ncbi:alpha/beta fold hydrolase [Fontimonas sp. SYSU GA230001]|uniref:alpha/beta hydrolase family protein n=1 Tax=Fontimonas sp. SYSU GA230001 TaxID=3142450 RepID=UPI0032B4DBD9
MHWRVAPSALLMLASLLTGCGSGDSPPTSGTVTLEQWPASQPGENPPPAPAEVEALIGNLDALAALLPTAVVAALFDPIAFGVTVRDLGDPQLAAFQVRATLAQQQDGSRIEHAYHWYGHPDFNDKVALVPVAFHDRYGTRLYGEIVLPNKGTVPPGAGPFPVILALEGLNTNVAMYRWWHQVFADAGYLVFAFDFSGQGHSDDEAQGDPGNNVEEAQDALTWLFAQSPVRSVLDATRVGVIGHSMGAITTMALQAVEPRLRAAVAAAPISEDSAPFDANPIPVMIQTGDHDGPIAPIPFVNPAVVRAVYDKLTEDRAFIVAEASSHAQHVNYPLLPTATWGHDIAGRYSLAWMDYHLRGDATALDVLRSAHPHLSYLWDSEVRIEGETTVMRGTGPLPAP